MRFQRFQQLLQLHSNGVGAITTTHILSIVSSVYKGFMALKFISVNLSPLRYETIHWRIASETLDWTTNRTGTSQVIHSGNKAVAGSDVICHVVLL